MAGCGQSEPVKPVVDLAPLRCPEIRKVDAAALRQRPVTPPPGEVTDAAAKAWIDGLEGQVRSMSKAGGRVLRQYELCRAPDKAAG